MNAMQVSKMFDYNGKGIRTVEQYGEVWWVLTDVCNILGIANARNVSARLDDDEKGVRLIDTLGGKQNLIVVNESGLYSVLLRSDKPEAKPFKRWVTHEILPSIRRTGQYIAPKQQCVLPSALLATPQKTAKDMVAPKKELVCDVPDNWEAQEIMREMHDMTAAVRVLLRQCNCYRTENDRKSYMEVLKSTCGNLYSKSYDLDRVKYKMVEKHW